MLHKNAKIALLERVPLFAGCSNRELTRIARLSSELTLPAGRTLTKEGTRGREFFVLVEGSAEVRRKGRRINVLHAGDFFGELALISDQPRTATVTTLSPVDVLVLSALEFRSLLRAVPSLQLKVLEAVAARLPEPEFV